LRLKFEGLTIPSEGIISKHCPINTRQKVINPTDPRASYDKMTLL